ncbi:MAG TPA: alpha/beta hydrolase [Solirubrobacterales bacterium]|nr:alpha/beta hydrolase [Solirubrobacterales bacterium]
MNGAPIRIHTVGSGPPVLLLHGSGPGTTGWRAWRPLCEALSDRFQLVAPDQAGFGVSPVPAGRRGERRAGRALWVEQAIRFMDQLGHERYAIVGHSMGGAVALAIAAARPDAVRAVVGIASMGAPMSLPEGLDRLWAARPTRSGAEEVLRLLAPGSSDRAGSAAGAATPDHAAVEDRLEAMLAQGAETYAALFPPPRERWVADLGLRESEWDRVTAPVLLLHGARDQVVPLRDGALPLVERLPNADLYVLGDCGHSPHLTRPELVHRLLAEHLETDA